MVPSVIKNGKIQKKKSTAFDALITMWIIIFLVNKHFFSYYTYITLIMSMFEIKSHFGMHRCQQRSRKNL